MVARWPHPFCPLTLLLCPPLLFHVSCEVRGDTVAQVQERQEQGRSLLPSQRASLRLHFQPRSREKTIRECWNPLFRVYRRSRTCLYRARLCHWRVFVPESGRTWPVQVRVRGGLHKDMLGVLVDYTPALFLCYVGCSLATA